MIDVACSCGKVYHVADGSLGKKAKCLKCGRVFPVVSSGRIVLPEANADNRERPRLGDLAVQKGWITAKQRDECLAQQKDVLFGFPLGVILEVRGLLWGCPNRS